MANVIRVLEIPSRTQAGLIEVLIDDISTFYRVQPTNNRTFILTKKDGAEYVVVLDGAASCCSCLSFKWRGECKHIAALWSARRSSAL